MKKILLATTVLVGTAGFAAAEVSLSGSARMGVTYDDSLANEVAFNSRARVVFTLSGETDGGLSFGGSFRADNAADANNGTAGSVFISGAFGKLAMGDTSSAAENAVGDLAGVGYTGVGDLNEMGYITTGDNEMALYTYSAGAVTVMASVGQPSDGISTYSLAGSYSADAFTVALGYEDEEGNGSHVIGAASGTFSGVTLKAIYGSFSGDVAGDDFDQYGVSATYAAGATSVTAFFKTVSPEVGADTDAYGIGAAYDLGGGAAIKGGISNSDDGTLDRTRADLGVTFSF